MIFIKSTLKDYKFKTNLISVYKMLKLNYLNATNVILQNNCGLRKYKMCLVSQLNI